MQRMVEIAIAAAGVAVFGGYQTLFVPPAAEQPLDNEIHHTIVAAPAQEGDPAEPDGTGEPEAPAEPAEPAAPDRRTPFVITLPTGVPPDSTAKMARQQLAEYYRMPIMDAPIEIDPKMAVVPDPSVQYSMPVIVPEPGIEAPVVPEQLGPSRTLVIRGNEPGKLELAPTPETDEDLE